MTTLDPANDFSPDTSYGLSLKWTPRPLFPVMAVFHFCAIAGVAFVCHLLVH